MSLDDATRPDGIRLALSRPQPASPNGATSETNATGAFSAGPRNALDGWNVPDVSPNDPSEPVRPLAALVSFHYLRAAVRRKRMLCLISALIGMLLGGAFLVVAPAKHTATTTLVLSHDTQVNPERAMATDLSLLTSRTVAENTIRTLGLAETPEKLLSSVTAVPTTSDVLVLTMSAASDAEAVRRMSAFATAYLEFRAKQVSAQSDVLVQGLNDRIDALEQQLGEFTARIQTLSGSGDDGTGRLSDVITQRAQLSSQIGDLQEQAQDATLRRNAIVSASRVIDPTAAEPSGGLMHVALSVISGLIGGAALGFGFVLARAILSDRLRLRVEVASALEAPVTVSVRELAPLPRRARMVGFLPWLKARKTRREADLHRVARAIEQALPDPGRRQRLAVACVDNSDEMRFGLAAAAVTLQQAGRPVQLVDLTEAGRLERTLAEFRPSAGGDLPKVLRPAAFPSLIRGPADLGAAEGDDPALAMGLTGVSLVLADLDPGMGAEPLTAWTDRVVVAVTGGNSSVERIRTIGDQIRSAGLDLRGALLIRAEPDDASSGSSGRERPGAAAGVSIGSIGSVIAPGTPHS